MEGLRGVQPIPWEQRKELGFFKALWQTIKWVLFKPGDFFDNLEPKSIWDPFCFLFVIAAFAGVVFGLLMLFFAIQPGFYSVGTTIPGYTPPPVWARIMLSFGMIIFYPVVTSISMLIGAAIMHLFVALFKGKGGYKGTFNVLAYSISSWLAIIIPFLGGLIGGIWYIILVIMGYKRIHEFSTEKAILAYFTPVVAFFVLMLVFFITIFGIAFFAAKTAG